MAERYPILYDLDRWRRYRTWLLFPATASSLTAIFLAIGYPGRTGATENALVVAVSLYALASSFWLRQRLSYVQFDGEMLSMSVLGGRQRLAVSEIRRIRVGRLMAQFERTERRRYLPRPARRWKTADALVIQLQAGEASARLRRVLGRRCVFGDEIVVPVGGAARLRAAVDSVMRRHDIDEAASHRRPRRRRKR